MIAIIVALAENRVIGNKGDIPWHIPEDFKLFKEVTLNSVIIMGRKTWESLPIKPLPKRVNIVISRTPQEIEGAICLNSMEEAIEKAKEYNKEIFVIGGSKIYEIGLKYADTLYLSYVKGEFKGDTYFPEINYDEYEIIEEKEFEKFTFKKYKKLNQ